MAAVGFPWRFVVTNRSSKLLTFLDRLATERTVNAGLNVPWSAAGVAPSDSLEINTPNSGSDTDPFLSYNVRFLFGLRLEEPPFWTPRFSGLVMQIEDVAGSDAPASHFTAYDPWKYLYNRPVTRDDALLPVNGLHYRGTPGHVIAQALLTNTHVAHGSCYIDFGQTDFYGGTIVPTAELDIDFDHGTSVGEAWEMLVATNTIDIVLTPIYDPRNRPGLVAELSIYPAAGVNRRNAIFAWDRPSRSVVGISHLRDGTAMANKIQGYTVDGRKADGIQTVAGSVAKYGQYWLHDFQPGQSVPAAVELLALAELALRQRGKESLTVSPAPERSPVPLRDYFPGDSVPIYASAKLRQPISDLKRVYAIPIQIRDDGTEQVSELLVTEPDE